MNLKQTTAWIVLAWAVVSGCLVSDLFVCPWTAVFQAPARAGEKTP